MIFGSLLLIILSIPFVIIYLLNNDNPYDKYLVNKYIPLHLEKMGYLEDDIMKQSYIQPKHGINYDVYQQGHSMVVFKDEPQFEYLYGVTKRGKEVIQFCEKESLIAENHYGDMNTTKTNHSEKECIGYLDNRD
ncbi:DUF3139 domain-containing protein [Peribacillus loiseleuriae]|uniref:DUF3139 domain-containing protein n=1 Tax=Peribacillus loiseleuriae TaxID=1679170 RepID=UPI003CFF0410